MAKRIIEENITNRLKSYKSTLLMDGSPDGEKSAIKPNEK